MIVTISVGPGEGSREIARLVIINDNSHPEAPEYGNYKLTLSYEPGPGRTIELVGDAKDVRRQTGGHSPFEFLHRVLEQMDVW